MRGPWTKNTDKITRHKTLKWPDTEGEQGLDQYVWEGDNPFVPKNREKKTFTRGDTIKEPYRFSRSKSLFTQYGSKYNDPSGAFVKIRTKISKDN